jgi:hypothetical protein
MTTLWTRLLESRVLGNLQARFGGGRMEKGTPPVAREGLRTPGQAVHLASRLPNPDPAA